MTQEALKLSLEALELCNGAETVDGVVIYTDKEIAAIKEALAQPEQEPVAYFCEPDENGLFGLPTPDKGCKDCFPVYRKRTWVRLAAEDRLTAKYMQDAPDGIEAVIDYLEAKLKDKNCVG
jgi:hypothetical protein